MANEFQQNKVDDIKQSVQLMAQKIKAALTSPSLSLDHDSGIVRLAVQVPCQPLLPWLRSQHSGLKTYWADRDNRFESAGVGAADYVDDGDGYNYREVFERLHKYLDHSDPNVRYYGGFTFAPNQVSNDGWRRFGRYYFILPRFELVKSANKTLFVCNLRADTDRYKYSRIMAQLETISFENDAISDDSPRIILEKDF